MSYILIPDEVAQDHALSDKAKILYGYVLRLHQMRKQGCYAQNEYFCDKINVHERQVQRYLSQLKEGGHVAILIKRDKSRKITSRKIVPKRAHNREAHNETSART